MNNTLIIYYPFISVCQGVIPSINARVTPRQLSTHRADFCLNTTDINYILDSHLNEFYLTLGWRSICLCTMLSFSEIIPYFYDHNFIARKSITPKNAINTTLYIKNYILKIKTIKEL